MNKTLISIAILASMAISQNVRAGEFSTALEGCEAELTAYYGGYGDPRIKFREAKNRGAGQAHLYFHVWPANETGNAEKIIVKCIAKKSTGDVAELQIRNDQTKQWALVAE